MRTRRDIFCSFRINFHFTRSRIHSRFQRAIPYKRQTICTRIHRPAHHKRIESIAAHASFRNPIKTVTIIFTEIHMHFRQSCIGIYISTRQPECIRRSHHYMARFSRHKHFMVDCRKWRQFREIVKIRTHKRRQRCQIITNWPNCTFCITALINRFASLTKAG